MMYILRILLMAVVLALVGCRGSSSPPPRPAAVPAHAIWVGGTDGGVFLVFDKKAGNPKRIYDAVIYYQDSGDIWFKGKLQLSAPGEIEPRSYRDTKFFSGWDGDTLYLVDGRYLTAMLSSLSVIWGALLDVRRRPTLTGNAWERAGGRHIPGLLCPVRPHSAPERGVRGSTHPGLSGGTRAPPPEAAVAMEPHLFVIRTSSLLSSRSNLDHIDG
jgi:hypothetical protein